jgi:hypothetical protein
MTGFERVCSNDLPTMTTVTTATAAASIAAYLRAADLGSVGGNAGDSVGDDAAAALPCVIAELRDAAAVSRGGTAASSEAAAGTAAGLGWIDSSVKSLFASFSAVRIFKVSRPSSASS